MSDILNAEAEARTEYVGSGQSHGKLLPVNREVVSNNYSVEEAAALLESKMELQDAAAETEMGQQVTADYLDRPVAPLPENATIEQRVQRHIETPEPAPAPAPEVISQATAQLQQAGQQHMAEVQQLQGLYNELAEEEAELREYDPAEYVIKRHDLDAARDRLVQQEQYLNNASQSVQAHTTENELRKVREQIPGWNDQIRNEVRDYFIQGGFSAAEVDSIRDSRLILAGYNALQVKKQGRGPTKIVALKSRGRNAKGQFTRQELSDREWNKGKNPNSVETVAERIATLL